MVCPKSNGLHFGRTWSRAVYAVCGTRQRSVTTVNRNCGAAVTPLTSFLLSRVDSWS